LILSVKKAMDILDYVVQKDKASVKDLSSQLGMPKSTICRLAQTLQASGYLGQELETGDYYLTYKFFRIGYDMLEKFGIRDCVRPVIKKLAEDTQETVNLTVLDETKVLFVEKIESELIHTSIKVGSRAPLHCTAPGKAILSSLPQERVNSILEKCVPFEAYTENTIVTVEGLLKEVELCRKEGYTICKDELANGVYVIGAPIRGYPGREAAALSISGPSNRFKPESAAHLIIEACEEITRRFNA